MGPIHKGLTYENALLPYPIENYKKVRDDKGYWRQIEAYIREHSEVEFSHSLCPECLKKLYPDENLDDL